jgi:hypothetical protein
MGIFGTLAFLFLLALVVRSFLIIWDTRTFDRKSLFALGLFFFIYLTNSFVSPITLTHKFIFWAVCGFIVGQVYRLPSRRSERKVSQKVLPLSVLTLFVLMTTLFAQAQFNYLTHIERYAADNSIVQQYKASPLLPCFMYFDAELLMAKNHGAEKALSLADEELANHPRCVAAMIHKIEKLVNEGKVEELAPLVYRLYEIAPARNQTLSLAMYYANRTGDIQLRKVLEKQMKALGLVYIPGQLG